MNLRAFFILILTSLCSATAISQEKVVANDSLNINERDAYIKDYTNQLNINLELSDDIQKFKIPFNQFSVDVEPNLGLRYALVFSYKFVSLRLGIRPRSTGESKEEKGSPKSLRFRFKLLFDKWAHRFEYDQVRGYYIKNKYLPDDSFGENHIQFPDLFTKIFRGSTSYKLNDNYSIRATTSQTEIQLKSAGSFIPSVDYSIYGFDGFDKYINKNGEEITRSNYIDHSGFTTIFNMGYYYTYVLKHCYANVYLNPGLGADFSSTTNFSDNAKEKSSYNSFVLSLQSGAGVGYNSRKIFFGTYISNKIANKNLDTSNLDFHSTKNVFVLFFGYRFNAPKTIKKPIDKLENKIPILK